MRSLKLPVLNIYEWECGSYWIYALWQKMKFHRIRERNGKYKFEFEAQCLHPLVMSGVFVFMITASTAAFQQLLNIKCRNHSEERVTRVQDDLAGTLSTESCIKNAASLTPRNPPSQLQLLTYLLLAFLRQGSCACGQIRECSSEAKWSSLWQVYSPVGSDDHLRFFWRNLMTT